MKDNELRKKVENQDQMLEIIFNDLNDAINNPRMKPLKVGPGYVRKYRDALQFLEECYPQHTWKELDLPDKSVEGFSADDLWDWKDNIAHIRGYLQCYLERALGQGNDREVQ